MATEVRPKVRRNGGSCKRASAKKAKLKFGEDSGEIGRVGS